MLDRLIQELLHGRREVSIYNTVVELRKHRYLIVQAQEQYIYIHHCFAKAIQEFKEHPSKFTDPGKKHIFSI